MARIWYRGEEQEPWLVLGDRALASELSKLWPELAVEEDDGRVFLEVSDEMLDQLEEAGHTKLVSAVAKRRPWFRAASGQIVQLFFLDSESEIEAAEVASNIVDRLENEQPITLADTGFRPLRGDEIEWNRSLWAKRKAAASEKRNLPVLRDSSILTAISEDLSAWTAADELYLRASSILLNALKESTIIDTKLGRAYAIDGLETISLELGRFGFQIEVKVDGRGTQWDYQPQGWLMNRWHTEGGYRIESTAASEQQIEEMIQRLSDLVFVCDQAYGR